MSHFSIFHAHNLNGRGFNNMPCSIQLSLSTCRGYSFATTWELEGSEASIEEYDVNIIGASTRINKNAYQHFLRIPTLKLV